MSIPRRPLALSVNLLKLALIFLLTSLAFAQQNPETLRGQVTDQLGGAAAGAIVTAVGASGVEKIVITCLRDHPSRDEVCSDVCQIARE